MTRYDSLDFQSGSTQAILSQALEIDKQWGFVIIRCSYESQEKWDTFLAITKQRVLHQIKSRDVQLPDMKGPDVYENLVVTVIEDKKTLDGADIKTTTKRFVEWLRTAGLDELRGRGEMQDNDVQNLEGEDFLLSFPAVPRYQFFIHADKEMIDTFSIDLQTAGPVDEDGGWLSGKNFLYVVSPLSVLSDIAWKERDREERDTVEEDENDEAGNMSKKIRGGTLLDLYVKLINGFDYFFDHDEGGFWIIT